MKKSLTLILAFIIMTPLIAQVSHSRSHQISIGYGEEWNAFLMPNTLISEGEQF